jgi:ABC-type lipoprotein release transport system permease subunit
VPTIAAVALFLAGTALPASYLPASHTTRVDPLTALRED